MEILKFMSRTAGTVKTVPYIGIADNWGVSVLWKDIQI